MNMIIVHKFHNVIIRGKHTVKISRRVPLVGAKIQCQGNYGKKAVGSVKTGKIFRAGFRVS